MYIFFVIWFSPEEPSARKVINTFIYSENDALRSMKQGSCTCTTEATLIDIGVYVCTIIGFHCYDKMSLLTRATFRKLTKKLKGG